MSIFYGADEYLKELQKKYEHDFEIAQLTGVLPDQVESDAAAATNGGGDKMLKVEKNDANRSLKTGRLYPTPNKPDPMPQELAFLFTKITPEQMMYMWNVLTVIFVSQCLMVIGYAILLPLFPSQRLAKIYYSPLCGLLFFALGGVHLGAQPPS